MRIPPHKLSREVKRIEEVVTRSEQAYFRARGIGLEDGQSQFFTAAPNHGGYQRTHLGSLALFLNRMPERLIPTSGHFADLGSGFGGPSFIARKVFKFKKVTGIEFDPELNRLAIGGRTELGLKSSDITLRKADFMRADLKRFDVIFMFRPFNLNFGELTARLLAKTRRDTRVIFHGLHDQTEQQHIFGENFILKVRGDEKDLRFWLYARR